MKKNSFSRLSTSDKIFHIINFLIVTSIFLVILYPIYYIFISSFSSARALIAGQVKLWPVGFNVDGYKAILQYAPIMTGFKNTIIYTVVGTVLNVIVTIMAAYPLSRKDLYGRNAITFIFAFTMWFSGGMIPTYLLYKNLNMINTPWVMIIPGLVSIWNMVITRTYFQRSIPEELLESAKIDGCSDFKYMIKILLPLSKPILAVITLYYAVGHWNSFFNAMIYLNDTKLFPLQLILRDILVNSQVDMTNMGGAISIEDMIAKENLQQMLKYSVIVVSSIPMLIIYPFVQKHFVSGIMVGSIKG